MMCGQGIVSGLPIGSFFQGVTGLVFKVVRGYKKKGKNDFSQINDATLAVHINGYPFLWIFKEIARRAPSVRLIRVTPSMKHNLTRKTHWKFCQENGIKIVFGYHNFRASWNSVKTQSIWYKRNRDFFHSLCETQKKRFQELLELKIQPALMVARYYCLNGEPFIPQHAIADQYGYKSHMYVSIKVNAVRRYLDPTFQTSKASVKLAQLLEQRVEKHRTRLDSNEAKKQCAKRLGIEKVPDKVFLSQLSVYEMVYIAWRNGELEHLKKKRPRLYQAFSCRFGLDSGIYLTLQEAGEKLGVTREAVRQSEKRLLRLAGIAANNKK